MKATLLTIILILVVVLSVAAVSMIVYLGYCFWKMRGITKDNNW